MAKWVLFSSTDTHECTAPKTDLQSRLSHIGKMCKEIEEAKKETDPDLSRLAYWVSYMSDILMKHIKDGES